jgi:hypothetical protein
MKGCWSIVPQQRVPSADAQTAPGVPTLTYPAEGQTVAASHDFEWAAPNGSIPGTTQYEVVISDPQTEQWVFDQWTTATSIASPGPSVLQLGHEYFYTVQACNGSACSGYARAFGFFIGNCELNGCFVYTTGANWGFQVGGGDPSNVTSYGAAAYISSNPSYNTGGVRTHDDVSGWLGVRDTIGYNACAPGYSPSPCNSINDPLKIFIQVGVAHDYLARSRRLWTEFGENYIS